MTEDDRKILSGSGLRRRSFLIAAACAAIVAAAGFAAAPAAVLARAEEISSAASSFRAGGSAEKAVSSAAADKKNTASPETASEDTVTVSSKGSAIGTPDLADLRFGIRTQAEAAPEAQEENGRAVNAVVKALKKSGINEENIQTTWYDVSPQYDWNTGNGENLIGYSVTTSLCVKDVKIDDTGSLITTCTQAGATEFNGMSFHCSNYDELYESALKNAVADAKKRAEVLAKASGRTLGKVRTIEEGWQDTSYASSSKSLSMEAANSADSGAADFLPGQAQITASLTVTFELR